MSRSRLPHESTRTYLTDGGLETTLVFLDGIDLPCFAAFPLVRAAEGRERLARYFKPYLEIARGRGAGFVLDTATWRANPDWAAKLGFDEEALRQVNLEAVAAARDIADRHGGGAGPILINGAVGPRGDGYQPGDLMSPDEAERYHARQIGALADAGVDMVTAVTMNYAAEAIGVARAAAARGLPVVVSFTVETDGRLATGQALGDAIGEVDRATASAPAYYMLNCAHPTHFADTLAAGGGWLDRIRGIRANASAKSHAELDSSTSLDRGDPVELARHYRDLGGRLRLSVVGGCCGTDHAHLAAICEACGF